MTEKNTNKVVKKKKGKNWFQSLLTTIILIGITTAIFLYTAGYRLSKDDDNHFDVTQTGMINVKSVPDGANVYLNGELKTATDGTISGQEPGEYNLRIIKNGFLVWEKEVEVFPELVTDITAILVSQSPRLEPLTTTGAREPTISPSQSKIAFFSKDGKSPGVWVIPLTGEALNLFRSNPYVVLEDQPTQLFSQGISIEWSPEEDELLVQGQNEQFYIVDLQTGEAKFITDPAKIRQEWAEVLAQKRFDFIEKLDIPQELQLVAVDADTMWAPDGKKFLYTVENTVEGVKEIEHRVYNMEKPIPVGEKVDSLVFKTTGNETTPAISWYSDSFHLVLASQGKDEEGNAQTFGKISLIRIDGTNKIEVYNGALHSERVYSAPGGDKVVFLTSFKSTGQTDLYTVGIR